MRRYGPMRWYFSSQRSSGYFAQSGTAFQSVWMPLSVRNQPVWLQIRPRMEGE